MHIMYIIMQVLGYRLHNMSARYAVCCLVSGSK